MTEPVILVHGGAGWRESAARLPAAIAACEAAARGGQEVLVGGGSALDAVERAVWVLEDEPLLNAGRGSYANTAGEIEMDALIMDGAALDLGAVIGITRVLHPISLARHVMSDTGGIPRKLPGRVGDSPLVGCGAYADNASAAVSATGDGEALMKIVISKLVADRVAGGADPQQACDAALEVLRARFPGASGGLIALDARERLGIAFNSAAMPHAYAIAGGEIVTGS
jgi:beta-aspartyl-peptidase (threonine type)